MGVFDGSPSTLIFTNEIVRQGGITSSRFAMNVTGDIDPDIPPPLERQILFQLDLRTANIMSGVYLRPSTLSVNTKPSNATKLLLEAKIDEPTFAYRRVSNIIDATYDSKNLSDFEIVQGSANFDPDGDTFTVTQAPLIFKSALQDNVNDGNIVLSANMLLNNTVPNGSGLVGVGNDDITEFRTVTKFNAQRYGFRYTNFEDVNYIEIIFNTVSESYTVTNILVENKIGYPDPLVPSEYVESGASLIGAKYFITENTQQIDFAGVVTPKGFTNPLPTTGLEIISGQTNLIEYHNTAPECEEPPLSNCEIEGIEPSGSGQIGIFNDTFILAQNGLSNIVSRGYVVNSLLYVIGFESLYDTAIELPTTDNHILQFHAMGVGAIGFEGETTQNLTPINPGGYSKILHSAIPQNGDEVVTRNNYGANIRAILGDVQKTNYETPLITTDGSIGGMSRGATRFRTYTQDRFKVNDVSGYLEFHPHFHFEQARSTVTNIHQVYKDDDNQFLITLNDVDDVFTLTKIVGGVIVGKIFTAARDVAFDKDDVIKLAFSLGSKTDDGIRLQVNNAAHASSTDTTDLNLDLTLAELQYLLSGVNDSDTTDSTVLRLSVWDAPLSEQEMKDMTL